MRRVAGLVILLISSGCWLVAGPGSSLVAGLACHHQMTVAHTGHHHGVPGDGPCFCDQMTGGSDLTVSAALPAPLVAPPVVTMAVRVEPCPSPVPLPPSPSHSPGSRPPNGLAWPDPL